VPLDIAKANPNEVLRNFIEGVRGLKDGVKVVLGYDIESILTAGMIIKALRGQDTPFEVINAVEASRNLYEVNNVVSINADLVTCKGCINLQTSESDSAIRRASSYILRYRLLADSVRQVLSEYVIMPKELRYLIMASLISKHTPRLLSGELSEVERDFVNKLVSEGLLDVVRAPQLIGWVYATPAEAAKYSVDIMVPDFFMSEEVPSDLDVSHIVKALGVDRKVIEGPHYLIKPRWFVKDIHLLSYILTWAIDVEGPEVLPLTVLNTNHLIWYGIGYMRGLGLLRSLVDTVRRGSHKKIGRMLIIDIDAIEGFSLTVAGKALRGSKLISSNDLVLGKVGDDVYIPVQAVTKKLLIGLLKHDTDLHRGYIVIKASRLANVIKYAGV